MKIRSIIVPVILVLVLIFLLKPKTVWSEVKRIRGQWNTILTLLVIVVGIYFAVGLWSYFNSGNP